MSIDNENKSLRDIKNMTRGEIEEFISHLGKETYRAQQIMKWLYQSGVDNFDDMTNLSKQFRADIKKHARISSLTVRKILESEDGTKKILFMLEDGALVESVLIREKNHWTLCVSTQVGCKMGCAFCLTGAFGFTRHLEAAEIAGQIGTVRFALPEGKDIKSIVMMGMGEPLDNYANMVRAVGIISDEMGLRISQRRITVSTCGLAPMIRRLGKDTQVNLAVSLNAADDETRNRLMPVNRKYPLDALIDACIHYEMPRRRRITFEYILMAGVNDSDTDARKLARLLKDVRCKFNLIPFNEFPGTPFKRPSEERIDSFRNILIAHRYTTMTRTSKGSDILAACGQLSGQETFQKNVAGHRKA